MLFSRVKIWCFRGKAHLVFYWCLYNNQYILYLVLLEGLFCISFCFKRERIEQDFTPWQINITFMWFYGYFFRSSRKSPVNKSAAKINPDKHEHEFCNYNCWERQPPCTYIWGYYYYFFFIHSTANQFWFCLILYLLWNKTRKVVSVGCVGPWKHNGVPSEFGKIRETGKICHVMSTQSTISP